MALPPTTRKRPTTPSESPGEIPDKLYFRIGEVAKLCDVPSYVLRFWESEFPQLKPNKGGTGQRLYRRRDVEMALRIKSLLYNEGYTIAGARQAFKAELRTNKDLQGTGAEGTPASEGSVDIAHLEAIRKELRELHALLSRPAAPRQTVHTMRPGKMRGVQAEEGAASQGRVSPAKPTLLRPRAPESGNLFSFDEPSR